MVPCVYGSSAYPGKVKFADFLKIVPIAAGSNKGAGCQFRERKIAMLFNEARIGRSGW